MAITSLSSFERDQFNRIRKLKQFTHFNEKCRGRLITKLFGLGKIKVKIAVSTNRGTTVTYYEWVDNSRID
jgi:hypothetical protein